MILGKIVSWQKEKNDMRIRSSFKNEVVMIVVYQKEYKNTDESKRRLDFGYGRRANPNYQCYDRRANPNYQCY